MDLGSYNQGCMKGCMKDREDDRTSSTWGMGMLDTQEMGITNWPNYAGISISSRKRRGRVMHRQ